MSETFAMVDPVIFAAVQEMIEKDSVVKEVCLLGLGSSVRCLTRKHRKSGMYLGS